MTENFWSSTSLEPKRQFRFMIGLQPGDDNVELKFAAKSADRPSYTIGETEHRFFNHTFYYPGRLNWNTVSITLVDSVTPGSTEQLYKYLATIGIANPTDANAATLTTITKQTATSGLGSVYIRELGSKPGDAAANADTYVLGEWELKNAFITEVNFGSHSYDSDDMVEITLTIRYDWAVYESFATQKLAT